MQNKRTTCNPGSIDNIAYIRLKPHLNQRETQVVTRILDYPPDQDSIILLPASSVIDTCIHRLNGKCSISEYKRRCSPNLNCGATIGYKNL